MKRLNYHQLYYFYVVATEGSIKAACQKLHVSQPTVSGQLKSFEKELGFKLFERKHRKLVLNEKGQDILRKSEKIFMMGEELLRTLPGKKIKERQLLRVGVIQTLPSNFLHDFTLKVWKDPNLKLRVVHGTNSSLMKLLNEDQIDLILSDDPVSKSSRVYKSFHLGQQDLVVVGREKYKSLKKNFPLSLSGVPFLSIGLSGQLRSEIDYYFKINGIQPDFIGQVDDLNIAQIAAENGHCVSILPISVAKKSIKKENMIMIGALSQVSLHFWLLTTQLGSKKILLRKLINSFVSKK